MEGTTNNLILSFSGCLLILIGTVLMESTIEMRLMKLPAKKAVIRLVLGTFMIGIGWSLFLTADRSSWRLIGIFIGLMQVIWHGSFFRVIELKQDIGKEEKEKRDKFVKWTFITLFVSYLLLWTMYSVDKMICYGSSSFTLFHLVGSAFWFIGVAYTYCIRPAENWLRDRLFTEKLNISIPTSIYNQGVVFMSFGWCLLAVANSMNIN